MIQRQPSGLCNRSKFIQSAAYQWVIVMIMDVHVLHGWKYRKITNEYKYMPKIKAEYTNKTTRSEKVTLGPEGLIKSENNIQTELDTVRQTYVELENSNIIPQNRETTQNHRKNNQRFEEIQLLFFRDKKKHRVEKKKTGNNPGGGTRLWLGRGCAARTSGP